MSHFYGSVRGSRGEATRCGTGISGMITYCASWAGAIKCYAYKQQGEDFVRVKMVPWHGNGDEFLLYEGPMGRAPE